MKNYKIRIFIWTVVAIFLIFLVGKISYDKGTTKIDWESVIKNKTNDQIALEVLEITSYKYVEDPLIQEKTDDYKFKVHLATFDEDKFNTGLYISFTDYKNDAEGNMELGHVDFGLYCRESDGSERRIDSDRLEVVKGTNIQIAMLDLDTDELGRHEASEGHEGFPSPCGTEDFQLVVGSLNGGELYRTALNDYYDVGHYFSVARLQQHPDFVLSEGYANDISNTKYDKSLSAGIKGALISSILIIPLIFGLYALIEIEIYENNVFKKWKNKK